MNAPAFPNPHPGNAPYRSDWQVVFEEERAAFVARYPKARPAEADNAAAAVANLIQFNAKRKGLRNDR